VLRCTGGAYAHRHACTLASAGPTRSGEAAVSQRLDVPNLRQRQQPTPSALLTLAARPSSSHTTTQALPTRSGLLSALDRPPPQQRLLPPLHVQQAAGAAPALQAEPWWQHLMRRVSTSQLQDEGAFDHDACNAQAAAVPARLQGRQDARPPWPERVQPAPAPARNPALRTPPQTQSEFARLEMLLTDLEGSSP
jgi:hypothetical protein